MATTGPVPQRSLDALRAPTHPESPRGQLAKVIPRRPHVTWWLGLVFAIVFAALVTPAVTADRWLTSLGAGEVVAGEAAPWTVRVPPLSGLKTELGRVTNGGIVIARGDVATADDAYTVGAVRAALPQGALPYLGVFALALVVAGVFSHHMRRSNRGRLVRVQIVSLISIVMLAVAVKTAMLATSMSVLIVPVAVFALVPTMALDRIVGLATGILAALVVALMGPFDVGVAIVMLVQAAVAGLVVAEHPKNRTRAVLTAGAVTTLFTFGTYVLLVYLTTGTITALRDPLHGAWFAAALGPAIATALAVPLVPLYQRLVGEITRAKLIELEDLSNPLLKQIAEKSPGTWQHSLMMANMAEIAANAIGADGRMVRVGAYYHDLGKSLQPKYFIENLEPGETSPHDKLPPEVSCDAIFAHVTEGIVAARKAGLHERIVDFMHMHHGNGVLEYFWGKCKEQGNPQGLAIEQFRYPGHPPQSRETAILAICDAVEAASRTLKKPEPAAIDSLVQRIVYGKLHLGQLDESGLSMSDLRRMADSLRETIRHANHGRIEYPWQKAQQDASASASAAAQGTTTSPRLDSLDRAPASRETIVKPSLPKDSTPPPVSTGEEALAATADIRRQTQRSSAPELAIVDTAPALGPALASASGTAIGVAKPRLTTHDETRRADRISARDLVTPDPATPLFPDKLASPDEPEAPPAVRRRPTSVPPVGELRPPADKRPSSPDVRVTVPPPAELRPPAPARGPGLAPDGVITPATLAPAARKRAATLPPVPTRRAPTVPPPGRRAPTMPPMRLDLENAVTNPPPLRQPALLLMADEPSSSPYDDVTMPAMRLSPEQLEDRVTGRRAVARPDDAATTSPAMLAANAVPDTVIDEASREASSPFSVPVDDGSETNRSVRLRMPLEAPPSGEFQRPTPPPPPGRSDLAARIDAQLERDEWGMETPVVAPTAAELRALLGEPDPTRQVSVDEIEHHRRASEEDSQPEILVRRMPHPTAEVDPDDIEAAIEVAPPARRPGSIAVAKTKKSE